MRVYIINWLVTRKILIIDHITLIFRDIRILEELFYNGIHNSLFISIEPIIIDLMNLILLYPHNTSKLQVIYSFNKIIKVFFITRIFSYVFHVSLILHPLHFAIQQFSHKKFSYLLMEINLVLIYWMNNILPLLMSFILFQIHRLVVNFQQRLRKICGSYLLMDKIPSEPKEHLMNSSTIRLNMENPSSV